MTLFAAKDCTHAQIVGNLGKDIEIRKSGNGSDYGVLTILVNKSGNRIETFKVLVFNQRVIKHQAKDLLEKVKVWIVGEMKIVETLTATDSRKESHPEVNCIIIDIENNRGISILESSTEQFRRV